jgi:hypothetical protein
MQPGTRAGAPDILIQPQNRLDMPPSELEPLAEAVRPHGLGEEVRILPGYEQRGYGHTGSEVVTIWLPWGDPAEPAIRASVEAIGDAAIRWARGRFATSPKHKYVLLRGPSGGVLRSVMLTSADAEPEDRTAEDAASSYTPPRPG